MTVTQEDRDSYGDEIISDIKRFAARPEVDQQLNQMQVELNQMKTQAARDQSMRILDADPEIGTTWRKINEADSFIKWCREIDGLSNQPRLALLQSAFDAGAGSRCAVIFKAYLAAARTQPGDRAPGRQPYDGTPGSVRPTQRHERRIWSRAEIEAFYKDVRHGVFREREPERLAMEREIIAASSSGRIADPPLQLHKMPV
ncbi:MAG TPA: hypothetical protein VGM07_08525 [Stellaceae bacterium]|jgi:hypothetical protein